MDSSGEITLADIGQRGRLAQAVSAKTRQHMLQPDTRKHPPSFSAGDIQALTGLDKSQYDYRIKSGGLPIGTLTPGGSRREFSLTEARQWVRTVRKNELRPDGAAAVTIAVGNFKGGVTKTTTAITLAQGLSLRGHRVLVIDCDPQGSLTALFGILPDREVSEAATLAPLLTGQVSSVRSAIQPTYWDGIDLVAAAPVLYAAEFLLGMRQGEAPGFEVWRVLDQGLADVRADYDVIVIDTPPALGYVTINALMAANGIIMPLPPLALDFMSSGQFWSIFDDVVKQTSPKAAREKKFSFINVLPARVVTTDPTSIGVLKWMSTAYADWMMPVQVPNSAAASTASANFGTVFDSAVGNTRTVRRAADAYEKVTELIQAQLQAVWLKQAKEVVHG